MCSSLRAVTNHTAEYFQRWVGETQLRNRERIHAAQALLAAGCGPARVPTCETVLRLMECDVWAFDNAALGRRAARRSEKILSRTLTLFGPGELHVLQSKCRGFTDCVVALLGLQAAPPPEGDRPSGSTVRPDILSGLRSLSLARWGGHRALESCGASLTELQIKHYGGTPAAEWSRILSQCPRLESLTGEFCFFPLSLLPGLAQLHTLHGVNFTQVPASAIAAALPRLHTLTTDVAYPDTDPDVSRPLPIACIAGFYQDLLPRLRVFKFVGAWPSEQSHASTDGATPQALPLLQELSWATWQPAPKAFMGGQPLRLEVSRKMVASWIEEAERASSVAIAGAIAFQSPLARVRQLRITSPQYSTSGQRRTGAVDMARLLRAAPQLRSISTQEWPDDDMYWCKLTAPADPAFAALVHPWLRSIEVRDRGYVSRHSGATVAPDVAQQLRWGHFPRLRSLKLKGVEYFGNPVD
jgi:hypothetical protein